MQADSESLKFAFSAVQNGKMVILIDDEDRENEGDLVLAAEFATPESINFMAKHARGLICLALSPERIEELNLAPMVASNQTQRKTAFTVSIEARHGVTTGISAADRAHTIRTAIDPACGGLDLISPGHIFPLKAQKGGVLVRTGHTEGSVDLVRCAGLKPAAVICEIMNDDGTMARVPELKAFSERFNIPVLTIKELVEFRLQSETLVEKCAEAQLPLEVQKWDSQSVSSLVATKCSLNVSAFRNKTDQVEHLVLSTPNVSDGALVRVHSECLTGDVFGSLRCDCGMQLKQAIRQITESQNGILIYMRNQEGRGIGLANKIRAYALQDNGLDTVQANEHLGFPADLRHYGIGAQIIRSFQIKKIRLLTNNPRKLIGLQGYGLELVERVPLETSIKPENKKYLQTKALKLGHHLDMTPL